MHILLHSGAKCSYLNTVWPQIRIYVTYCLFTVLLHATYTQAAVSGSPTHTDTLILLRDCPSPCNITFVPSAMDQLPEGETLHVEFNISCDVSHLNKGSFQPADDPDIACPRWTDDTVKDNHNNGIIALEVIIADDSIATIEGPRVFNFTWSSPSNGSAADDNLSLYDGNYFKVHGRQYGWTDISIQLKGVLNDTSVEVAVYHVSVIRERTVISIVFLAILGVMILVYNFGFGCKVRSELIVAIVKKPVGPAIGFCCQFMVMAPLSFGLAKLLRMDDVAGLGLLAIGCSPGGGGSNVFAYLLDGDLELSITMTFISTLASLGLTPLWLWGLGRYFTNSSSHIVIPVANVFSSLAIVTIPVTVGVIVTRFKPRHGAKMAKMLKPLTGIIGAIFISMGIYVYYYALVRVTWQTMVACSLVPLLGYIIGAIVGIAFRQEKPQWITISLETGFQNLALALMILGTSLKPPASDLAGVVPICYSFLSAAFPAVAYIIKMAVKLCRRYRARASSETILNLSMEEEERDNAHEDAPRSDLDQRTTPSLNSIRPVDIPDSEGSVSEKAQLSQANGHSIK